MSGGDKYRWILNDLLVGHLGFGVDFVISSPVPAWFVEDLARAWWEADALDETVDDYRTMLRLEGLQVAE